MKCQHKGFEIKVTREKSMTGDLLVFYSIFRLSDNWEFRSGFYDAADTVRDLMEYMKAKVDDYLENPSDYEEA